MKINVVGGGIFGCTIAWMLAEQAHSVRLYEKEKDIFMCASGINQYRLHRGYHYPRSKETATSCRDGEKEFREVYGDCVLGGDKHYYGVAKEGSFLDAAECSCAWQECGLAHKEVSGPPAEGFVNKESFESIFSVDESSFDCAKLKSICWERMNKHLVKVFLNTEMPREAIENSDLTIIACYAYNNSILSGFPVAQETYQFELIEKLVLKVPKECRDISLVVQDGPFLCIDPIGNMDLSLMGNVVHAIHHSNIGKLPEVPESYKSVLNKGVVMPSFSKAKKFFDAAEPFFPWIHEAEHIGSMFTIRTVLPYHEFDDARPTVVDQIRDNIITVFSGKIPTCVSVAKDVLRIVEAA